MAAKPRVLHAVPGRLRVHLPGWLGGGRLQIERHLHRLTGVQRVEANPITGNVLIGFDLKATDQNTLLAALGRAEEQSAGLPEDKPLPPVIHDGGQGSIRQARIAVRGLDRDPKVARNVVERLRRLFGVRAQASLLTSRVLVEYDESRVDLRELLAHVAALELPDVPGEDRPAHPLDVAPLLHAATRTVGAALGLGLIAARRLLGLVVSPSRLKVAATAAGIIGLLRSFPFVRNGLRQLLGRNAADLSFSAASVVALSFSGSPLGLTVTGLEGLLLLHEVMARRSSWRRYEEKLQGAASAEPGALIRLEAGERVPLEAEVVEGTGTAIGRDGLPRRIVPGAIVHAGAELSGGPFVLQLLDGRLFLPEPRPAPLAPTIYTRYIRIVDPLSLGYACLTAALTRSVGRTFTALLLVNPRPAIIGLEAANLDAAGRVLRAGVTVVGTRPDRAIRLPDVLLLDGPRVLTSGLEISTVLALDEELDDSQVLALAGGVAGAAGSPWGKVFPSAVNAAGTDGVFNGLWAAAQVQGVRYTLGPPEDPPAVGEAVQGRHHGGYLLMLSREEDGHPLGLVALRPRRVAGAAAHTSSLEITAVLALEETLDATEILGLARGISTAAGSPWGPVFSRAEPGGGRRVPVSKIPAGLQPSALSQATAGSFNGLWAAAQVQGVRYTLGPPEDMPAIGEAVEMRHEGGYLLVLCRESDWRPLGFVGLRPRLSRDAGSLVQTCRRLGVRLEMLPAGAPVAAQAVARRAGVCLVDSGDAVAVVCAKQQQGEFVAFVSDSAHAAAAFADCDLAIGLAPASTGDFPARTDLLAPDLRAIAAILEAGARRDRTVRDAVVFSAEANVFGAVWGLRSRPGVERASTGVFVAALAALADGWLRLRGGKRPGSSLTGLVDPRPERWGRQSIASVLRALQTTEAGLTSAQAKQRRRRMPQTAHRHQIVMAVLDQLRSPVNGILTGGALLSLISGGAPLDIVIIGATVFVNVVVGVWQERQAGKAVEALRSLGTASARVLRNGAPVTVPATAVVPGDVLLLAPGDRVAADARLLEVQGLEVDEAALTGESVPVSKWSEGGNPENHIVLEGSGVVVGTGRALVVAAGRQTRLGAIAAALSLEDTDDSPFGARLARLLQLALPIAAVGGVTVFAAGILWSKPLANQLAVGASIALAVVPESLPLLAGTGQVGAARRLARRRALLRRLSAVEALGRVDVACTDKTGTLTEGRLAVRLVTTAIENGEWGMGNDSLATPSLRDVLLAAALASPHPEAVDAAAHPTDVAVVRAAQAAGLEDELRQAHQEEDRFDPDQAFHATLVGGRLCVKGAPEEVVQRCTHLRGEEGVAQPLEEEGRQVLLNQAQRFAECGLRVLMVADGPPGTSVADPQGLQALGFVGIADPLRPSVPAAVRRCQEAGVRVIMITGDHPATARAIAHEAGLTDGAGDMLTGAELTELDDAELERRMEKATVIARATPLDKLRIMESLRRLGHTVAMTGDGVNDAPALRLAEVGVAMGRGGTEVARQAADLVLADDDFSTLVEALVEGRGFWGNMRRALGLLLGGNAGELGLIVGATVLGFNSPLNTRQILVVNLITDALPALAVALQPPEHRHLAGLAREGASALDASLRRDVLRRGVATAVPALAGYFLAQRTSSAAEASSVAFGTVVATQLAQTLDTGWVEESINGTLLGAVAGSAGLLLSGLTLRPLRNLLGLGLPTPFGWTLIGSGAAAAVVLSRLLVSPDSNRPGSGTADPTGARAGT
jgi:calcium-translocating P-type ATPase